MPVFVVAATGNATGIVLVSENTGAITYCTNLVNLSGVTGIPSGSCAKIGTAIPSTGSSNSLALTSSSASVFVENRITGQVLQCSTLDNVVGTTSTPEGSCKSVDSAAYVPVPNVVGLTQSAATTAITKAELMLGTVTKAFSCTVSEGTVTSESPVAGSEVIAGSAVSLVVSGEGANGPAPPCGLEVTIAK